MGNVSPSVPPLRTGESRRPAPGDLALLQGFLNTRDPDDDAPAEDLADPQALERWLIHYGLMRPGEPLTQADLDHTLRVREALRAVLVARNGGPGADAAIETLNAAAKTAELLVSFDVDGTRLKPVRGGVDGAIGHLLAIVERAQVDGTWERLKGCPDSDCGWIFYDWSKNRSATWCSMEVCGNRAKARAYRERRRSSHAR